MIGAPLVLEMKIYIESGLKSDQFLMYAENFRISRNVCLFFIFGKFSKPMRANDVERKFFLGWPKYQFKFRYLVKYQFKLRHLVKYQFKLRY